jgi:hypothetical protein
MKIFDILESEKAKSPYAAGWSAGYGSYSDRLRGGIQKNPYQPRTPEYDSWNSGFEQGRSERDDERSDRVG